MNKCKKMCRHFSFGSTLATALIHFICCGLPALIAIISAIFGLSAVSMPFINLINPIQRTYLLILGGILLSISFIAHRKERKICQNHKMIRYEKIILFTSAILFAIGLIFHIISMMVLTMPSCH